ATACDSYTWAENGQTYTVSGTYTHVSTNAAGCPHTATLNLTINNSTSSTESATACDSYTWSVNGQTYTVSGTYTHVGTNAAGCPHTATLNLTINSSTSSTESATACDSYTWAENGQTYTVSGTYTHVSTNAAGCPHTATLNLTINSSTSSTESATACDSYTWAENGATYTVSGTYTHVTTNAAGCPHTATLNLTINSSTSSTESATACDSYTWAENGQTYTVSGTYTHVSTNAAGCPHTATLNLTVNSSTSSTESATACDSYTWAENGQTYTVSGTYTHVSTNAAGCPHTATLNLTINNSSSSFESAVACDSYIWGVNGQAYTMSGTYTHVSTNASGCPHTSTLDLVINSSTSSSETVTACNTYTWAVNGSTYTASGVYTHTGTNASGCPHTYTLNLTIDPCPTNTVLNFNVLLEGYYIGGGLMISTLYDLGLSTDPTASDSIDIMLWSPSNLSNTNPDYSVKVLLQNNGTGTAIFPSSVTGNSFYIAVKHRNSVETWSANPVAFSSNTSYNFTDALNKAYDDGFIPPMQNLGSGLFGIYGGDTNYDGAVDGLDMNLVDNDASFGAFGYNLSDITGDGATDGLDMNIIDNNATFGVFMARPY
ncbi:MAG: hypothetical protein DWQ39_01840, partial [Bacteroidetes bacterium]